MVHDFQPGDYLIFQIESGYGLLRVLGVDGGGADPVWHLAGYSDLFMDVDMADAALEDASRLAVALPHVAITNRAFESTQVAKMGNSPLTESEIEELRKWNETPGREVYDRSIRLLLGLR